jgi:hypothetical protein
MNRTELMVAILLGICGVALLYVAFLAHELFEAGATNHALGIGGLVAMLPNPVFWVLGSVVFAANFYAVRH